MRAQPIHLPRLQIVKRADHFEFIGRHARANLLAAVEQFLYRMEDVGVDGGGNQRVPLQFGMCFLRGLHGGFDVGRQRRNIAAPRAGFALR